MNEYTFIVQLHGIITMSVAVEAETLEEAELKCCEQYGDEYELSSIKTIKENKRWKQ